MDKQRLIRIARGDEQADLVLKNGKVINVFSKTIEEEDIAIADGIIIGLGDYQGKEEINLSGYYISPGFIDGHVHIESSMLTPNNYALATMPRGTTSIVADCHEIANVAGKKGIDFMLNSSKASKQDVFMMIPSCVPSTQFESNGATLLAKDIKSYTKHPGVYGLGEMMDYTGVVNANKDVLEKLEEYSDLTIDGHAPELSKKELNAYVLAGVKTDHECVKPKELIEKVKRGMYIHLREGSQTKNLLDLLLGVTPGIYDRIMFCSDDLHPNDIINIGHMDQNIRLAISNGLDPIIAISMATINIANCYQLEKYGAIAPGYYADLVMFKDINEIDVEMVYKKGELVAKNHQPLFKQKSIASEQVQDSVHIDFDQINLDLSLNSDLVYVIGLIKNNVTTKKLKQKVSLQNGLFLSYNNSGLLKLAVIERHHRTGNIGFGIVKDYGLRNAAIAMTIAHDSHNLICLGDNDKDMYLAIKKISDIGGGIVLVSNGKIIEYLSLEVAGLMSLKDVSHVEKKLISLEEKIRKLGVNKDIEDPFLQLAFLSLAVIPEIKVTDKGLFDVKQFKIIPLEVGE
ncbi:MAG: adenine deaminase [Tenericutes bacterium]|nr:adenine deaminase [Mycoplasmatota bacterium]